MFRFRAPIVLLLSFASLVACTNNSDTQLLGYNDADWHFGLSYPSQVEGRALIANRALYKTPLGSEYIILLSDLPNPSPTQYDSQENLRVIVTKESAKVSSFEQWATAGWSSWGSELRHTQTKCTGLSSEGVNAPTPGYKLKGVWLSNGENYFAVIARFKTSRDMDAAVQIVLSSFAPSGCS